MYCNVKKYFTEKEQQHQLDILGVSRFFFTGKEMFIFCPLPATSVLREWVLEGYCLLLLVVGGCTTVMLFANMADTSSQHKPTCSFQNCHLLDRVVSVISKFSLIAGQPKVCQELGSSEGGPTSKLLHFLDYKS